MSILANVILAISCYAAACWIVIGAAVSLLTIGDGYKGMTHFLLKERIGKVGLLMKVAICIGIIFTLPVDIFAWVIAAFLTAVWSLIDFVYPEKKRGVER